MSKWRWLWLGLGLVGCGDAVVGTNPCANADAGCDPNHPMGAILLAVDFTEVATGEPMDLPIKWQLDSPCASPCMAPIQLSRAGSNSVWSVPRTGLTNQPTIDVIDGDQTRAVLTLPPAPMNSGAAQALSLSSDSAGKAVVHVQWASLAGTTNGPEQLVTASHQEGSKDLPSVQTIVELQAPRQPLPLDAIAVPLIGALLFDGTELGGSSVQVVNPLGAVTHKSPTYPDYSQSVGTSAVRAGEGYVIGSGDGATNLPQFGLLSVDGNLRYASFAVVASSSWRSVQVSPWSAGAFVAAASSDVVIAGALPTAGQGNIDVVMFQPADVDFDTNARLRGFRLRRSCINRLTLNGLTSDANGTLYVSSVAGTELEPRGLLCRMPVVPLPGGTTSTPQCWQAAPNVLIGQIVAADDGALFAAVGQFDPSGSHASDQIVRIELP